ncbi:sulfite exporter TauE/SafE family protein [Piscinibacter sp. HJYY11]|uniref:sulfite exporter TauE/SafE family protein n=1 Tax=Piscinibacter sp. HJYY11 TaxID=2801333 RepID=UPI00191D9D53|nr:sulfite exporter TauE/SafE family protein [Piscinibacter sp. HJYY11]MBL0726417.1 sulfite exporter TauE/SafE family protein [Piscinibacter sp. HJYY11]
MELALVFSAALMGLAGVPHCLAMCGGTSAGVIRACGGANQATLGFHVGRLTGYAAGGAVAASSVALLRQLGEAAPALRPVWVLVHLAVLGVGLWLVWTGRQPQWMQGQGRSLPPELAAQGWQRVQGPVRAAGAGMLWLAWPCGLLQSALVVATLAGSAAAGAAVMAAFAITSSIGLVAGPALWLRLGGDTAAHLMDGRWAVRLAGAGLVAASGWALGHGLWARVVALCLGP